MAQTPPFIPTKIADRCSVSVGETLTYTIMLQNTGAAPLTDVSVADVMPPYIQFTAGSVRVNGTPSPDADPAAGFTVPDIEPQTTRTVTLQGVLISQPPPGVTVNTANITYKYTPTEGEEPVLYSADSNACSVNTPLADLSLTMLDTPNPVDCQEQLTFIFTIENLGPTAAREVVLHAQPSSHVSTPMLSFDGGKTWETQPLDYTIGTMEDGEKITVLLRGKLLMADEMGGKTGISKSSASVTSQTPDPDMSNNTAGTATTVTEFADMGVAMTAAPNPVEVGKDVTYEIDITNYGPCGVFGATVVDTMDPHLINRVFSLDGQTWEDWPGTYYLNKTILKDQTEKIYLRATVKDDTTSAISSTVSVSALPVDVDVSNNSATVDLDVIYYYADLQITHFGSADVVNAGETITYTAAIKNLGPNVSADTIIQGDIASGLVSPEISHDNGQTWETWTGTHNVGTLEVGAEVTVLIRGILEQVKPKARFFAAAAGINAAAETAADTEVITNTLSVGSATKDPSTINNIASVAAAVVAPAAAPMSAADLAVTCSVSETAVNNGANPVFTVKIQNIGTDSAQNVVLTCPAPAELMNATCSVDGGNTWNTYNGTYGISELPPADENGAPVIIELLIRGTVNSASAAAILLNAVVSSDTVDTDVKNNAASAVILANANSGGGQPNNTADVSVVVAPSPAFCAKACSPLDFAVIVSNAGPAAADGVGLNIPIPDTLKNVFYTADGGQTFQKWTGNLVLGTMQPNEHRTIILREMLTCYKNSEITLTAQVYSSAADSNYTNNSYSAAIKVF